jgi:hypothetical protein
MGRIIWGIEENHEKRDKITDLGAEIWSRYLENMKQARYPPWRSVYVYYSKNLETPN